MQLRGNPAARVRIHKGMEDAARQRTTSFAKSVDGLVQQESALDRAQRLKAEFLRHQEGPEPQQQRETERYGEGSRMVRADAPVLRPAPAGFLRQQPDRQAAYGRLSAERANENQKLAAARRALDAYRSQHRAPGQERDRER